ncbi:MAG: hypothetical protein WAO83_21855 [Fuerstiella sp.]
MASSESRRRKQLEKKKKKRDEKRHSLVLRRNMSLADKLKSKSKYPIYECYVSESLLDAELGEVIFTRRAPTGEIVMGMFLIDRMCMGVKNCFGTFRSMMEFRDVLEKLQANGRVLRPIEASTARQTVERAVQFAADCGLSPHADYASCKFIFGDTPTIDSDDIPEFGINGKPHFIPGPFESGPKIQLILARLQKHCGAGNYHFTLPLGVPAEDFDLSDTDFSDDEEFLDNDGADEELLESETPSVTVIDPIQRQSDTF